MADAYRPARAFEFSLTLRQILAIIGGSMVVLMLAFGIGVGFGHRLATTPTVETKPTGLDHLDAEKNALPTPSPATLTYQQEVVKADPNGRGQVAPPPKPVVKEDPPPAPKPAAIPTPTPTPAVAAVTDKPAAAVPAIAKPPEPTPTPEKPAAPKGERWTIQFGAPTKKVEADKLVARLAAAGLEPFVVEADIPGKGHFYRVRVGQFASKADAERSLVQASAKTKLSGVTMPMQ